MVLEYFVWRCVLCIEPTYLLELFILTSAYSDPQSLRSRGDIVVPQVRTAIKQHMAFLTVGASAWNRLQSELRSLPWDLSSSFFTLLKIFLFTRTWAGSASE